MMYTSYEKPLFSACFLYYDDIYSVELADRLRNALAEFGFYPPSFLFAGKLTHNRYVKYNTNREDVFLQAYTNKDILTLELLNAKSTKANEFCQVSLIKPCFFKGKSWNVFRLSFTYDKIFNGEFCVRFIQCVKALIGLLDPFFARLDDMAISNSLSLDDRGQDGSIGTRPTQYGTVKAIYWGNYYSRAYCEKYLPLDIANCSAARWEQLGEGMFFAISDKIRDFCTKEGLKNRMILTEKLHLRSISADTIDTMKHIDNMLEKAITETVL